MKKFIGITTLAITFCLSAVIFSGCQKESEISEVRVAYFPNITHAQALVMKEQGRLEKELEELGDDLSVKWTSFNAGPAEIEAMFAGEVDLGYIGPVPAVSGYIQSSGDLKIIAGASNGGSVLVARNDVEINSAAELDGKTVAIPQIGNTQHLSLLSLLRNNNLAPVTSGGTVTVAASSNADIANLMDQKNIDAALVPEPWGSILELGNSGKVVLDFDQIDANGVPSTAVVIVNKDFLEKHRNVVEKFIKVHKETTDYINNNTEEAKKIINNQIYEVTEKAIDEEVLDNAFKRLEVTYEIPNKSIMDFAQISVDEGIIAQMPDEAVIDGSFVK